MSQFWFVYGQVFVCVCVREKEWDVSKVCKRWWWSYLLTAHNNNGNKTELYSNSRKYASEHSQNTTKYESNNNSSSSSNNKENTLLSRKNKAKRGNYKRNKQEKERFQLKKPNKTQTHTDMYLHTITRQMDYTHIVVVLMQQSQKNEMRIQMLNNRALDI